MMVGPELRSFLVMLAGAVPPAVATAAAAVWIGEGSTSSDIALVGGAVVFGSVAWIALVAVSYGRWTGQELAAFLEIAERGEGPETADAALEGDSVQRRLAAALEERNRQVAELARQVSLAPIGEEPRRVVEHVVDAARSVTRDPTWSLVVLASSLPDAIPPGIYDPGASAEPEPLGELHRWAGVAAGERLPARVSRVEGPWGAFMLISVGSQDELRALLIAPWEGRVEPSGAETALLSLVGEHAGTAIEHALLYARVHAQAEDLDRMAGIQRDFLRAVSHDLQTPLTSIRAVAAELKAQPGLGGQAAEDLDLIEHQADRLRRMVAQLLVVSRLEAGVVEPQPEVLNPRPLIERTWTALRAAGRDMEISVAGEPLLVVADPDRLEQVLWAVLDNAVKYSPDGGAIRVHIEGDGDQARIAISDEGMGMDPRTAGGAFEQFYRSEDARRVAPDGSGIGLYAARGLMAAMGGAIEISSQLGQGTTVTLVLPAEPIAEGVAEAQHQRS